MPRRRLLTRNPDLLIGGLLFGVILAAGLVGPALSPYDPVAQDTARLLQNPSAAHLLGTDHFGRDIFTRVLYGTRSVLLVAFVAVGLALTVGGVLGMLAGYLGGTVEAVIMRLADLMLSFPLVLLAVVIVVALGPGLLNLALAVGISQVPIFVRLAQALTLVVRQREFVQAARCVGARGPRVLATHIVPNIFGPLLIQASTTVALAILNSTALNFLGLGVQPPSPDWGAMVSDFRRFVFDRPWLPLYPGLAIALTVLSINLLGDGLILLLDPTARKRLGL